MHNGFRIRDIKQINGNNRLWEVQLTLTSDNNPQFSALTKNIRKRHYHIRKDDIDWVRLTRHKKYTKHWLIKHLMTMREQIYIITLDQFKMSNQTMRKQLDFMKNP